MWNEKRVLQLIKEGQASKNPKEQELADYLRYVYNSFKYYENAYMNKKGETDMVECENCGEKWTEQELNSYAWCCLRCGHKIGRTI